MVNRAVSETLLRRIRVIALTADAGELPDRVLVQRFAEQRDEGAFTALVRRHGPMVLGVCRRVLGHEQDAEDAFQATFLVLSRKAGTLRNKDAVGPWLFGVAHRLAVRALQQARKRRQRESRNAERIVPDPPTELSVSEALAVLDKELASLPERERGPLVLCYFEGLTRDEAAQRLGCPLGTLKSRLERAREALQKRLTRRGVSLSAALATLLFSATSACAMPAELVAATVKAGVAFTGGSAAASVVSANAAALAESVLQSALAGKLKIAALCLLLSAACLGLSRATTFASRPPVEGPTNLGQTAERAYFRVLPLVDVQDDAAKIEPGALQRFLDLQPKANQKLTDNLGRASEGNDLVDLPKGEQSFDNVKFKIDEGFIQLGSKLLAKKKPDNVAGIRVAQKFAKLHILHATCFGDGDEGGHIFVPDGTQIGEYKVHYDDGSTQSIPIVYGQDVRDFWFSERSKGVTRSKVAWQGDNELAKKISSRLRLYLTTWENPSPQKIVTAIDYLKVGDSLAAPFCIAITLQHQQDDAEIERRVPRRFLDLQPHANHKLKEKFSFEGNSLASLPIGEQVLAGTRFNIGEGLIQLSGRGTQHPGKVEGIQVGAKFGKLNILHATHWDAEKDPEAVVAYYTVNYEDKSQEKIPVVYGKDVSNWWHNEGKKGPSRADVAWKGTNGAAQIVARATLRLYVIRWSNPQPARRVASIDFVSTHSDVAPFCVAVTAEE